MSKKGGVIVLIFLLDMVCVVSKLKGVTPAAWNVCIRFVLMAV